MVLENLRDIKAKHSALCCQVKEISKAQKESIDSIRHSLSSVMELMQHVQSTTDVEVIPTQTVLCHRNIRNKVHLSHQQSFVFTITSASKHIRLHDFGKGSFNKVIKYSRVWESVNKNTSLFCPSNMQQSNLSKPKFNYVLTVPSVMIHWQTSL